MVDSKPLTGLRGLASFYIVCFHAAYYSPFWQKLWLFDVGWTLNVFFLLSGFSLALGYGDRDGFSIKQFYQNRFARIAPIYYFFAAICLPFVFVGYGLNPHGQYGVYSLWTAVIENVLGTTSWCIWWCGWAGPFCGPSWFISTLLFFYLCFPFLLPPVKRLSDIQISRLLIILFYLQLSMSEIIPLMNQHFGVPVSGLHSIGEWVIIRHPLSRLPVFLMGVLAGMQQLKIKSGEPDMRSRKNILHDFLPWDFFSIIDNTGDESDDPNITAKIWARKVNIVSISLPFIVWFNERWSGKNLQFSNFIIVQCTLTIILGITRDKGFSIFTKICSSRLLQFLGKISATIFMLHNWLMKLICWLAYGRNDWHGHKHYLVPEWGVPIVIMMSPLLSWLVHVTIEEPCRKWLRSKPEDNGVRDMEEHQKSSDYWILAPFLYLITIICMRLSVWYFEPEWLKY